MKIKFIYIFLIFSFLLSFALFAQSSKKFELAKIQFVGNDAVSTADLNLVILSKESPNWFSQLLFKISSLGGKAIYFDSLYIPNDINALKGLYQSKGFFKAQIHSRYILDTASSRAELIYTINESQPALFKSFVVKGLDSIASDLQQQLADYVKVDSSTVYQDVIVDEKKNFILNFLRDHGYMLAKIDRPNIVVDTMKNRVEVELKFETGKRYKIGDIHTTRTGKGFDLVGDDLLKEIVAIKPGNWYSYYDIQRGQVRLYRTNLFTSAVINSIISDTLGNTVPLNISADLGLMHELSPEIIMNNEDNTFNLGLALNFVKKNFLGDARKFTAGASIAAQNISDFIKRPSFADSTGYGYYDLRVGIEQPFLFGRPINTKLETYFTVQKRKNEYNSALYGGRLGFDFEMPQFTYFNSFNTYLRIERSEYSYKEGYLINLASKYYQRNYFYSKPIADSIATDYVKNVLGGKLISQSTNATIGANIGANKTNELFFPTRGYSLLFLIEDANSIPYLVSRIFKTDFVRPLFFKAVVTSSFYLPFYESKSDAFGVKFKAGQIFTYRGDKADIPLNQRLYSGGSNSVRGWGTRQLVPKKEEFNLSANPTQEDLEAVLGKGAATGGFFLFEGSIETRNRLFERVGSALFVDYGNTWNGYKEFRFNEVAIAAGFGFRYYSDYLPIRIDFGFRIYDPNDRRSVFKKELWNEVLQFHIGIGEAF